jgi:hypothetical protein
MWKPCFCQQDPKNPIKKLCSYLTQNLVKILILLSSILDLAMQNCPDDNTDLLVGFLWFCVNIISIEIIINIICILLTIKPTQ